MKYTVQILVIFSINTFCFGDNARYNNYNQYSQNNYDTLEWSGYTYNINEGQCRGLKLVDEEISKKGDPFTIKKTSYTWMGRDMYYITCIKVQNRMPRDDKAAEARIVDGGVGQGVVKIEMVSKNSQRIQFQIEIWGEATRQQADNVALLTNTPNKVLYMGGKKYCECR